ncbi:MAG: (d)CMP kinase [Rhodospirillales bacterium]|nr:(d)CMP kinase [Rhodospirillales bacterium]
MIIAIDGPAAAGKGTLARRIAEHFGFALLDTGLLYRAVGVSILQKDGDPADAETATTAAQALNPVDLENPDLRGDAVAGAASKVGAIPAVREALLAFQRNFATSPPGGEAGAVLDGRDIGTVVCPEADAKLFVTASVEVRAERRVKELRERGLEAIHSRVLHEMKERDRRDASRAVAPLEPAEDAFLLDTSDLDPEAVFAEALSYIQSRCGSD